MQRAGGENVHVAGCESGISWDTDFGGGGVAAGGEEQGWRDEHRPE